MSSITVKQTIETDIDALLKQLGPEDLARVAARAMSLCAIRLVDADKGTRPNKERQYNFAMRGRAALHGYIVEAFGEDLAREGATV